MISIKQGTMLTGSLLVASLLNVANAKSIHVNNVIDLQNAVKVAVAGDTIWVAGGEYRFESRLNLMVSGSQGKSICLFAEDTEKNRPVFNGSSMAVGSSNQVVKLQANYWYIKGIDMTRGGDNGILVTKASNNTIEYCRFFENKDSGMQIDGGSSNNSIVNCDSYLNADPKLENADGFACKMDVGGNNKFIGCRSWNNLDDGWDGYLRETDNVSTVFENCWAFNNGFNVDGTPTGGDGNGFKTGGSDTKLLKHNASYTNCIAAGNFADGFDHNSNKGTVVITGCKSAKNKNNFNFSDTAPVEKLIVKNCVVLGKPGKFMGEQVELLDNSWDSNQILGPDAFVSTDIAQLLTPRQKGGGLPQVDFLVSK